MDEIKLFVGYYGRSNIGDDLMLKVLYKNASSYVFLQGESLYNFIPYDKQIILSSNPLNKLFQKIYKLLFLKVKGCNEVVFGGGTQFSSNSKLFTQLDIFIFVLICRILNVKVSAQSIGIGALSRQNSLIIWSLRMMTAIQVRDQTSSKKLSALKIKHQTVKDLVYQLNLTPKKLERKYTLITATGPVLKLNDSYTKNFYAFLETYISKDDRDLIYCVFQKGEDEYLYEILKRKYPSLKMIEIGTSIESISTIYSKSKQVVGMRYHSLILADIFALPFKGFSYDDKVKDLCHLKNMPFHNA